MRDLKSHPRSVFLFYLPFLPRSTPFDYRDYLDQEVDRTKTLVGTLYETRDPVIVRTTFVAVLLVNVELRTKVRTRRRKRYLYGSVLTTPYSVYFVSTQQGVIGSDLL